MALNTKNIVTVAAIALAVIWVAYNVDAIGKIVGVR